MPDTPLPSCETIGGRPHGSLITGHFLKVISMRPFMLCVLLPLCCVGDELPPTLQLPTKTVITETMAGPSKVETTKIVDEIKPGVWYVIRSKTKLFVMDFPAGSVSIISGASSADGIFADGDGKPESRVFPSEDFTYLVQGQKPCKCELALIPAGVTERSAIFRQTLTVSNAGPQPPPVDPVKPDPVTPNPEPLEPVKSFRVIFVKESSKTLSPQQSSIPAAAVIQQYLDEKTTKEDGEPGHREYDPDQITTNEQPIMKKLWETVKPQLIPAPCIVIEKNGHAKVMPFPANVDECLKLLKEYGG